MIDQARISYPPRWDKLRKDVKFPAIVLALAFPMMVIFGLDFGEYFSLILGVGALAGIAALWSVVSWHFVRSQQPCNYETRHDSKALLVRQSRVMKWLWAGSALLGTPVFAVVSLEGESAFRDQPIVGSVSYWVLQFLVVASPVLVAILATSLLGLIVGKLTTFRSPKGVGIGLNGIYHWWWGGCSFYPWDSISDIRLLPPGAGLPMVKLIAEPHTYAGSPVENWIGKKPVARYLFRRLNLWSFQTHPGLVYQAMFFYWRHPELRSELGSERAVERMQQGDYGDIPGEIREYGRALAPSEVPAA